MHALHLKFYDEFLSVFSWYYVSCCQIQREAFNSITLAFKLKLCCKYYLTIKKLLYLCTNYSIADAQIGAGIFNKPNDMVSLLFRQILTFGNPIIC